MRPIARFSSNLLKRPTRPSAVFNGVNLLFGTYFFFESLASHPALAALALQGFGQRRVVYIGGGDAFYNLTYMLFHNYAGMANPAAFFGTVLGIVPIAFSIFFYAIPIVRARRLAARNERARVENLRRVAYRTVLDSPIPVRPESIPVRDDAARPKDGRAAAKVLTELAAWSGAEPQADGSFSFAEIERGKVEAAKARAAVDESADDLGGVAFDSDAPAK